MCLLCTLYSIIYIFVGVDFIDFLFFLFVCLFHILGGGQHNLDTFNTQLGNLYEQFKIISFSVSSFLFQP